MAKKRTRKKRREVFDEQASLRFYGTAVRRFREEQNLSLRALADQAGISAQALLRIEQGVVNVKVITLDRVLFALGFKNMFEFGQGYLRIEELPTMMIETGKQLAELLPHMQKLSTLGVGMEKPEEESK